MQSDGDAVGRDSDMFDQQLDDPRLLGGEQLVPDRGEVGEQDSDLALGDLVPALSLRNAGRGSRLAAPASEGSPQRTRANRTSTSWAIGQRT